MQRTTSQESSNTATGGGRALPTREQEEYVRGFDEALDRLYQQRGAPVVVRARSLSMPAAPTSNSACASLLSAVAGSAVPLVVTDLVQGSSTDSQVAAPPPTTIPLCVAQLASNDFEQYLGDEAQQKQPTSDGHSTGMSRYSHLYSSTPPSGKGR